MTEPSKGDLLARIAELEKQVGPKKQGSLEFKVGEKGRHQRLRAGPLSGDTLVRIMGAPEVTP